MTKDFLDCLAVAELHIYMARTIDEDIILEKQGDKKAMDKKRLEIMVIKFMLNEKTTASLSTNK